MTFDEARDTHLRALDKEYAKLRSIAADADWVNPNWPTYVEALRRFEQTLKDIVDLNGAQVTAEREKNRD